MQWKATLTAAANGHSPELESVDVAYLPKNVEPHVDEIEITPPNYSFPPSMTPLISPSQNLNLPPLGRRGTPPSPVFNSDTTSTPSMQPIKGYLGARWLASDPNGDSLVYSVEIRGVNETEWKPLKDKVAEKYFSWDSTAFPDGEYRLRVTASDAPGNPPAEALDMRMPSATRSSSTTRRPRSRTSRPSRNGAKVQVKWHAADALNNVTKAEYSLDGGEWTMVAPVTRLSDSPELDYDLTVDAARRRAHHRRPRAGRLRQHRDRQGRREIVTVG